LVSTDAREPADRKHGKQQRDAGKNGNVNDRFALTWRAKSAQN
jgi:hypothetical protein